MRKTKLQKLFEELDNTNTNRKYSYEDFEKKLKDFGRLCYQKALGKSLLEIDYLGNFRELSRNE